MNVDKEGPTLKIVIERRLRKMCSDLQFWLKRVLRRIDPKRPSPYLPIDAYFDWCIRCWRPGWYLDREKDRKENRETERQKVERQEDRQAERQKD
jgi:hypothetical protein